MEAIKFDIFGGFAHFKNPEQNLGIELSFETIPKPALAGLLGALLGLKGREHGRRLKRLEYWEELKTMKIAIIPHSPKWEKTINELTNSTGFFNKTADKKYGATQIVRMQMLENVRWTIILAKDGIKEEYYNKIYKLLLNREGAFPIFLGKSECFAKISAPERIILESCNIEDLEYCDSILRFSDIKEIEYTTSEEHYLSDLDGFVRKDYYPIGMDELGFYKIEKMLHTNQYIEAVSGEFYTDGNLVVSLF